MRVYDVRDPARPREVAYYNPPAHPGELQPATAGSTGTGVGATSDLTSSDIAFFPSRNEIGFTSQANGLQVVRLTNGVRMRGAPSAVAAGPRPAAPAAAPPAAAPRGSSALPATGGPVALSALAVVLLALSWAGRRRRA